MFQFAFFLHSGHLNAAVNVTFQTSSNDMIDIIPRSFQFKPKSDVTNVQVQAMIIGRSPGHIEITAAAQPPNIIEYVDRIFHNLFQI